MLTDINKNLAEKRITIAVSPEALAKLAELGYDPQFGARPMRRVIQQKVENLLAKKMLEGSVQEGGTLNIGLEDIG
jgi:ATP-dependent Clp protease ATP-binding subunit ClpA